MAATIRSTASAWAGMRSLDGGRAPRRPTGRLASGRRGRSRTSVSARPRRTSPASAAGPWRPLRSAAGSSPVAEARSASSSSTWRGPRGRPARSLPGREGSGRRGPLLGEVDPAFVARPGTRTEERPFERHGPVRGEGSQPAQQPGPAVGSGKVADGARAAVELRQQVGFDGVRRRARAPRPARQRPRSRSGATSATSSSRSSSPGGSIARSTSAGGAR